jgi:hypothetical protein
MLKYKLNDHEHEIQSTETMKYFIFIEFEFYFSTQTLLQVFFKRLIYQISVFKLEHYG